MDDMVDKDTEGQKKKKKKTHAGGKAVCGKNDSADLMKLN